MSDETSRSGYDDVLSSVRRIVSNEIDTALDDPSGKLLLTPALRVADAEEAGSPATADRDFPTLEERIAELEASVVAEPSDWEPDGSEDQTAHRPNGMVLPLHPEIEDPESPAASDETFSAEGAIDAPIEDTDEAVAPAEEPEVSEPSEDAASPDMPDVPPSEPVAGAETTAEAAPLDDAALNAVSADDQAGIIDVIDETMDEDASTPEVVPPLATFRHRVSKPIEPLQDTSDTSLEDDTTLLDEAALRDLVAEVVREELQGGLGERITRNVRKLVRAEIQRAFAARDLD